MNDHRSQPSAAGSPDQPGAGAAVPPEAGPLADLQAMIEDIRAIGVRLLGDLSALALAQWRLTTYVMRGSLLLWAVKIRTTLMIWGLVVTSWVFLNVSVWRLAIEAIPFPPAQPLAVVIFNVTIAAILVWWRNGLRLK